MEKPIKLAFSDYATFRFLRAEILYFIGLILTVIVIARVTMDDPLAAVTLSEMVMSALCFVWIGVFVVGAWGYRVSETIQINRMFRGEIWECWQFSAPEWESQVDAVSNLISPKLEGSEAYSAVINSSIFGAVVAIIMDIIVFFAVKDPMIKKILWLTSGVIFLLFAGAGLFEPLAAKMEADRYRRKALQFREPRVWFGPDGLYHESLGHTSLKELHKVTDQTKSRKAIQFTIEVSSESYDDLVKLRFPVPAGCEERAGNLVRRYRTERLIA